MAALDPKIVAKIRRMAGEGVARNEIARRLKIGTRTVTKYAPPNSFDRTATAAAVKAHQIDAAARRAEISQRILDGVEHALDDLAGDHLAFGWFGKDADYHEKLLERMPPAEKRALAATISSLMGTHMRLEQFNLGDEHQDARDAIVSFGNAIREMVNSEQPEPE